MDRKGESIEQFVRRRNVRRYRQLLETTTDGAERQRILSLLAEERQEREVAGGSREGE
jgi:hypothetical protein